MIPRRRAWVVIGVVLASFLPAPEAVAGEEDWSQREILTRPGVNGNAPRLFAAADGALTAAWVATSASSLDWALVIRTRPAGGTWSIEQVIEADVSRYDIELAVDSRLVAAYLPDDGAGPHVRTQVAAGSFGPIMLLAPGATRAGPLRSKARGQQERSAGRGLASATSRGRQSSRGRPPRRLKCGLVETEVPHRQGREAAEHRDGCCAGRIRRGAVDGRDVGGRVAFLPCEASVALRARRVDGHRVRHAVGWRC